MNGLRLLLLLIGVVVVALVYLWGTRLSRRRIHATIERGYLPDLKVDIPRIQPRGEDEVDVAGALADLNRLKADAKDAGRPASTERRKPGSKDAPRQSRPSQTSLDFGDPITEPEESSSTAAPLQDLIVALFVAAPEGAQFAGPDLMRCFDSVGLSFGDMGVFHHYGVGQSRSPRPLFSVASMFEPGIFDREHMDRFSTRGLALFMRLPVPLDGKVAFELLLNTAQRLAGQLDGALLNEQRHPITAQDVERLRDLVARHEHARA